MHRQVLPTKLKEILAQDTKRDQWQIISIQDYKLTEFVVPYVLLARVPGGITGQFTGCC